MKRRINLILNNMYVERFLIILILLNLFAFIFETDKAFYSKFSSYIQNFELASVVVFSIEYILRVLALDKIKYIFKPLMVVDLLAILPFYLSFIKINTVFLRVLRLCRLLRVAKLTRYTNALTNIKNAFVRKKDELIVTGLIFIAGLVFFSILIYFAEHNTGHSTFKSIPSSFWWTIITFTSVGYGDTCPVTTFGKFIAGFAAVVGICLNGLFIGIMGSAFMDALSNKTDSLQDIQKNEKGSSYEKINC